MIAVASPGPGACAIYREESSTMRSQFSLAALAAAGIALCTGVILSWNANWLPIVFAAQRSFDVDPQGAIADTAQRGDRLFQQQKWSEARAAYDQVLKRTADEPTSETSSSKERAIECSVKLHDFDGGLRRATPFPQVTDRMQEHRYSWPTPNNGQEQGPVEEVAVLEKYRQSLEAARRDLPVRGDAQLSNKLTQARIAADLDLMKILDPDVIPERTDYGWASRYPDMQWWVNIVRGRGETENGEEGEWWVERESVPLAADGRPVALQTPAAYAPGVPRAAKILFLISEIERLDSSPNRDGLAKALLHRADIARRLYGPNKDEAWRAADFGYRMYGRPTFHKRRARHDLKEFWQLDDDESRSLFAGRLRVVRLPASESPLAIWARIEKECPNSRAVAEAIYQRGFYYQNRQQFSKAEAEFRRLMARFPKEDRAASAAKQLAVIEHAGVLLGNTGQYLAGTKPKLWFACRQTGTVEFVARRFDLIGYLKNRLEAGAMWRIDFVERRAFFDRHEQDQEAKRFRAQFTGPEVAKWSVVTPRTERVTTLTTQAPLAEIGAYVVEARAANSQDVSSALVIVTETAVVQKLLSKKNLLWVVNARTGRPLVGQKVTAYLETRKSGKEPRLARSSHVTDHEGLLALDAPKFFFNSAFVETQEHGVCICGLQGSHQGEPESLPGHAFGVTDRPVYRPGSKVNFRVWVRDAANRQYQPPKAGVKLKIQIQGQGDQPMTLERTTDEWGSVTGSIDLGRETGLGDYSLWVDGYESSQYEPACKFTVEEYKRPEFEVTVQPPKTPPRLGDVLSARVTARYYFGAPVAGGTMQYQVIRRPHRLRYSVPREWDWLYGNGFGDYGYDDPWIDAGDMQQEGVEEEPDQTGRVPEEIAATGTAALNAEGWVDLRIDTAQAPRDSDQEYRISVSVRDESRRTVKAEGAVVATRQASYAFAEMDGGWYGPGAQATVDISTRSAQNSPIDLEGTLTLYRVSERAGKAALKSVANWRLRTGPGGHAHFPFHAGDEGQYRLEFASRDAWQQPVRTVCNFWVYGPKFDTRQYHGGGLEIIPDRRWYQPGETARVLLLTAHPNVRLFVWDCFQQRRFLDVPGQARILVIPLLHNHVPNYLFEATYVAQGGVHTEKCELFVPPRQDVVNLELRADRPSYGPGQKGHVRVHAFDPAGKPVSGSMVLTAYDKALTYFQSQPTEGPQSFVTARKIRLWLPNVESTLGGRQFSVFGKLVCPEFHLDEGVVPPTGGLGGSPGNPGDPAEGHAAAAVAQRRANDRDKGDASGRREYSKIRTDFSETAAWFPNLRLDQNGTAEAEIAFPDSTTTWRICGCLITNETHVGDAVREVTTSKPFLVRLEAPRFAVFGDEVTLAANIHNDLESQKDVRAELIVPAGLFQPLGPLPNPIAPDNQGFLHLTAQALVAAHSEHRFDWPLKARGEGAAAVTVRAECDAAGDAMGLQFPVEARGTPVAVSQTGISMTADSKPQSFSFELPPPIDPSKTEIDISLAPSAGASCFDALPFLAGYPYGCVEQTMSRFYPTVVVVDTLHKLGLDLKTLAGHSPQSQRRSTYRPHEDAVLDPAELDRMTKAGLERLYEFQHGDGGWGWWEHDESTSNMTAYVLFGLDTAARAGVKIDETVYEHGITFLYDAVISRMRMGRLPGAREEINRPEERAFVMYVLSLERSQKAEESENNHIGFFEKHEHHLAKSLDALYAERAKLNPYGKILLALFLHHRRQIQKSKAVLAEVLAAAQFDASRARAWIATSRSGWWHWYNNDIETNAWLLRALTTIDPRNPVAPQIANWLAANRIHGKYWHSTRDTALAVHALADEMQSAMNDAADFGIAIAVDGRPAGDAVVSGKQLLSPASRVVVAGRDLNPGRHQVTLTKKKPGQLYYSIVANYFDRSERIVKSGHGIQVEREYFKCSEPVVEPTGSRDQRLRAAQVAKTPLQNGESVQIGQIVETELTITSDDHYEYIAFEDPKPAGFEPVEIRSGYAWGDGLCADVELRDEKIVFFAPSIAPGRHVLRYQLRAETPGSFQARPTHAFDMYNPEIEAHSDSMRLQVRD
jgi:alpha-2-macroglobulin